MAMPFQSGLFTVTCPLFDNDDYGYKTLDKTLTQAVHSGKGFGAVQFLRTHWVKPPGVDIPVIENMYKEDTGVSDFSRWAVQAINTLRRERVLAGVCTMVLCQHLFSEETQIAHIFCCFTGTRVTITSSLGDPDTWDVFVEVANAKIDFDLGWSGRKTLFMGSLDAMIMRILHHESAPKWESIILMLAKLSAGHGGLPEDVWSIIFFDSLPAIIGEAFRAGLRLR